MVGKRLGEDLNLPSSKPTHQLLIVHPFENKTTFTKIVQNVGSRSNLEHLEAKVHILLAACVNSKVAPPKECPQHGQSASSLWETRTTTPGQMPKVVIERLLRAQQPTPKV